VTHFVDHFYNKKTIKCCFTKIYLKETKLKDIKDWDQKIYLRSTSVVLTRFCRQSSLKQSITLEPIKMIQANLRFVFGIKYVNSEMKLNVVTRKRMKEAGTKLIAKMMQMA